MSRLLLFTVGSMLSAAALWSDPIGSFQQTNLVSDIPGLATNTDPNLINPWGIAASGAGPFWVSDNGNGKSTLYNGSGIPISLVVTIPNPSGGTSAPTGQVFNSTGRFNSDNFVFATENGTIAGWRGALGTNAEILYDNSGNGAVYKGLALATNGASSYLLAADFHNNRIDVFPGAGALPIPGKFIDPNLPAGYAPFNIQDVSGQVYVTYAKQGPNGKDEVDRAGNGLVSVFDTDGNFLKRIASNGLLNSPWGVAIAPAGFGTLGGDLLVGNFGDGTINAYTLSGSYAGTLSGTNGTPLANDGLWALTFGNGGSAGSTRSLFVTAGLNGENDGLLARIDSVPEPGTLLLFSIGLTAALLYRSRRQASE